MRILSGVFGSYLISSRESTGSHSEDDVEAGGDDTVGNSDMDGEDASTDMCSV